MKINESFLEKSWAKNKPKPELGSMKNYSQNKDSRGSVLLTSGLLKTGKGMRSYSSHSRQMIIYSSRDHHLARSENEDLSQLPAGPSGSQCDSRAKAFMRVVTRCEVCATAGMVFLIINFTWDLMKCKKKISFTKLLSRLTESDCGWVNGMKIILARQLELEVENFNRASAFQV